MKTFGYVGLRLFTAAGLLFSSALVAQEMSFFVTSSGPGGGGNLGGLAGADAHCQALADAAGHGDTVWRAYLSTQGPGAVHARDRIGTGPWYNVKGQMIARDLAHLHGDTLELARRGSGLHEFHVLDENGEPIKGSIDAMLLGRPNEHDILTGSMADGRAFSDDQDHTCSNWTSGADVPNAREFLGRGELPPNSAQIGHHDGVGRDDNSWNSSHATAGCSQENLVSTGGAGLLYCFAPD